MPVSFFSYAELAVGDFACHESSGIAKTFPALASGLGKTFDRHLAEEASPLGFTGRGDVDIIPSRDFCHLLGRTRSNHQVQSNGRVVPVPLDFVFCCFDTVWVVCATTKSCQALGFAEGVIITIDILNWNSIWAFRPGFRFTGSLRRGMVFAERADDLGS